MRKDFVSRAILVCILVILTAFIVTGIVDYNRTANIVHSIVATLTPFIIGAAIAYVLNPFYNKILKVEKRIFKKCKNDAVLRYLSIAFTEVFFTGVVTVIVIVITPSIVDSVNRIMANLPNSFERTKDLIDETITGHSWLQGVVGNNADEIIDKIQYGIVDIVEKNITEMSQKLISIATNIVQVVVNICIGLVVNIMILANKDTLKVQCIRMFKAIFKENQYNVVMEEIKIADKKFAGFFAGKILDSFIVSVITLITTLIMGIEYPWLVTIIIGVTNIVPFFGPFIGGALASVTVFSQSPVLCIYFLIFVIILQQVDGNIIGPKCIGNKTNLNSFWTLLAILIFGKLFGIVGMIIGVPLFAVIYDVTGKIIQYRINKKQLLKEGNKNIQK